MKFLIMATALLLNITPAYAFTTLDLNWALSQPEVKKLIADEEHVLDAIETAPCSRIKGEFGLKFTGVSGRKYLVIGNTFFKSISVEALEE